MAGKKGGFDSDSEDEKPVKSAAGDGPKGRDTKTLPFLSAVDIRKHLKGAESLTDSPEELIESVASYLTRFSERSCIVFRIL